MTAEVINFADVLLVRKLWALAGNMKRNRSGDYDRAAAALSIAERARRLNATGDYIDASDEITDLAGHMQSIGDGALLARLARVLHGKAQRRRERRHEMLCENLETLA